MKWLLCENNKSDSKYWQGRQCHEEVLVDEKAVKAVCWKCVAMMVPIEPPKPKSGYPRGWKFMAEFVDKDGNVFHKGELQADLFGTKDPTPIKEVKKPAKTKKGDDFDAKVEEEMRKRLDKKRTGKSKVVPVSAAPVITPATKATKKTKPKVDTGKWFAESSEVTETKPTPKPAPKKVTRKTSTSKPKVAKKPVKKVAKKVAKKVTKKAVKTVAKKRAVKKVVKKKIK